MFQTARVRQNRFACPAAAGCDCGPSRRACAPDDRLPRSNPELRGVWIVSSLLLAIAMSSSAAIPGTPLKRRGSSRVRPTFLCSGRWWPRYGTSQTLHQMRGTPATSRRWSAWCVKTSWVRFY